MSVKRALWCRCGGSVTAQSSSPKVAEDICGIFERIHVEDGCEVTDDPIQGRKWTRAAVRRANRASV